MKKNPFFSSMLASLLAFGLNLTACGPSIPDAVKSASSIEAVNGLENKLAYIFAKGESGKTYVVEIKEDERLKCGIFSTNAKSCSDLTTLSYKDKSNITIVLKGDDTNRTITRSMAGARIFAVGKGVTLILDGNITLKGEPYEPEYSNAPAGFLSDVTRYGTPPKGNSINQTPYRELILVEQGGTLIMNDGSALIDNTTNRGAGGAADIEGTFVMKGGTISGNACAPRLNQTISQEGSTYSWVDCVVGGVGIGGNGHYFGSFTKTGGTISGNFVKDYLGNNVKISSINLPGAGFVESDIGAEKNLEFKDGKVTQSSSAPAAAPAEAAPAPIETPVSE